MSKLNLSPKQHHLENAKLARQGKKTAPRARKYKEPRFEIFQNEDGEWMLRFQKSKNVFVATDVEVALWVKLKELEGNR